MAGASGRRSYRTGGGTTASTIAAGLALASPVWILLVGWIIVQVELLSGYIDSARNKKSTTDRGTFANTIHLYTMARQYIAAHHEEDWPPASYITL